MTFAISIGKYGGFYWSRAYTIRLCLGWIAFTWYPFEFEGYHNAQVDRTISLMDCYRQAVADAARLQEELDAARAIQGEMAMPPNLNKQTPRPPFEPHSQFVALADDILVNAHIHIDVACYVDLTIRGVATLAGKDRLIRMIELAMDSHIDPTHAEQELLDLRRVLADFERASRKWDEVVLQIYEERDAARKELDALSKEHVVFKTGREE